MQLTVSRLMKEIKMSYDSFQFDAIEYAEELTAQTHSTLAWLANNNYITDSEYDDLVGRLIVTPIRSKAKWGKNIIERLFGKPNNNEVTYVFPMVLLDHLVQAESTDGTDPSKSDNVVNINSVQKKDS